MSLFNKKIVVGVTGSIAAYKAVDIVRQLQDKGARVMVIMTKSAQEFIRPLTFESITQHQVGIDLFDKRQKSDYIKHISFAQEADILLIAPATANVIGKLSSGISDDLLTCTAMATKAQILIAPAMNEVMYQNPIMQNNCNKLKENGFKFIDPIKGKLACGDEGEGHLAQVEKIVDEVSKQFIDKRK